MEKLRDMVLALAILAATSGAALAQGTGDPAPAPGMKAADEIRQLETKKVRLMTSIQLAEQFKAYWESEREDLLRRARNGKEVDLVYVSLAASAGQRAAGWAGKKADYEAELQGVEARLRELRRVKKNP